jgi:glycine/D-amino acid oxidase-like deaminating enzyme/nitrite reductase/ring-hydroxylating ferredoxin subunit
MRESTWQHPDIEAVSIEAFASRGAATDVCVIGGGVAGLTTAYFLACEGRSVVVLDAGELGNGETLRTTAQLVTALDRGWTKLVRIHGVRDAAMAADSHASAIDRVEQLVRDEGIACGFERIDGYLSGPDRTLQDELEAAHSVGLADTRFVYESPAADGGCCLRFPQQAQLEPGCYERGLAAAIRRRGGTLVRNAHVTAVEENGAVMVRTSSGAELRADAAVVATNSPFNLPVSVHLKQSAYRSYVIAADLPGGRVPHMLFWDSEEPFHYVRLARNGAGDEVLVVGGEDHKTGQDDEGPEPRFARLEEWTRRRFPDVGRVTGRWSGQIMESMDGLAFIGPASAGSRVHLVTGDSGNGFTHATIAGMLLGDLLCGRENPWSALYDPSRIRVRGLPEAARENLNVAAQLAAWVAPGEAHAVDDVAPGHGAIVRRGLHLVAAYRDPDGRLHECSAVCPHLRCVVAWNATERSWDCPCHGSRFDPTGRVVHGPAIRDLGPPEKA